MSARAYGAGTCAPPFHGFIERRMPTPEWIPGTFEHNASSRSEIRDVVPYLLVIHTGQSRMRKDVSRFTTPHNDIDPLQDLGDGLAEIHEYPSGLWVSQGHHRIAGARQAQRSISVRWVIHTGAFQS